MDAAVPRSCARSVRRGSIYIQRVIETRALKQALDANGFDVVSAFKMKILRTILSDLAPCRC